MVSHDCDGVDITMTRKNAALGAGTVPHLFFVNPLKDWSRYCAHMDVDHATTLLSEDPAVYMNFFDWMQKSSKDKRLQTYDEYWRRLCQYFTLFAQRSVNQVVHG